MIDRRSITQRGPSHPARRTAPFVFCVLAALLLALPAAAQKVQVRVARGPHYIGDAVGVNIVAEGFEEDPEPTIEAGTATGGRLVFQGMSPQVSSSITIVNGRMTREKRVRFTYHYVFTGTRPGRAEIPPFVVTQGAKRQRTAPVYLELRDVETSDEIALNLRLPDGPLFVGQRARVAIEFAISREMQNALVGYSLHVPLFESGRYRFIDDPRGSKDTELQIETDQGTLVLAGASREVERRGKRYLIVRADRTIIPLEAGTFEIEPATVTIDRSASAPRGTFRSRRSLAVQKYQARSKPVVLEVADLPSEGRPPSFAGAIGRGFSVDVAADRSVVQVGEPIQLTFTVRGDGDLTTASLPPLDAPGLLDPDLFRVPNEPPVGRVDDEGKHFEVTVRVLDDTVREIPALEYAWFDASTRRFETTATRPIALSVGAAEVIGAGAVARRSDPARPDAGTTAERDAPEAERPIRSGSLALTGADLGIERRPQELLRDDRAAGGGAVTLGGLYALGLAFVGVAFVDRRRRDVDPVVAARHRSLAAARAEVEAALSQPGRAGATALARALRAMLAAVPQAASPELDALLGECDARSYAPDESTSAALPEALREQARRVAAAIEEAGQ